MTGALRPLIPGRDAASGHRIGRLLFVRGLGAIYLVAIASWWTQAILLTGENGLVPAGDYLSRVAEALDETGRSRWQALPNLYWMTGASDAAIHALCTVGCLLALMVLAGLAPGPALAGLWAIYLTFLNTGNVFMSFQWDILLLETGFLALFIAPWKLRTSWRHPDRPGVVARTGLVFCWFLAAKLMFLSGWVKLAWATGAHPEWWPDHTAMTFHYQTQPIPTWTAWWMHQLPAWFHKLSIWPMYGIELILPLLVFFGRWARLVAGLGFIALMVLILLTGNYTFFNYLTIVISLPLIADSCWPGAIRKRVFGLDGPTTVQVTTTRPWQRWLPLAAAPAGLLIALLNIQVLLSDFHRAPIPLLQRDLSPSWLDRFAGSAAPFRLVSGYGLFRTMTTDRPEIILEGSRDGIRWEAYDFRWKPDRLEGRPRFVAPHQPRVAWQLWFAALERQYHPRSRNAAWIESLLGKLLEGDESVQALFVRNPFPESPPRLLRARLFLYEFTSPEERRASGEWWTRRAAGDYLPVVSKR